MSKRRFISRRDFLFEAGTGISGLALLDLLEQDGLLAAETARSLRRPGGLRRLAQPAASRRTSSRAPNR